MGFSLLLAESQSLNKGILQGGMRPSHRTMALESLGSARWLIILP